MAATNIRDLVDAFTQDLESLIREEIRRGFESVLGGGSPGAARAARRPGNGSSAKAPIAVAPKFARPGRKKGEKRTPAQLAAVKTALGAFIDKSPGKRIEEISAVLKIPTSDLSRPLHKLIAEKKVRRQGEKRASRYFPTGK